MTLLINIIMRIIFYNIKVELYDAAKVEQIESMSLDLIISSEESS